MFNIGKLLTNPPKLMIEKNVNNPFISKRIEENKVADCIYKIYCNKEIEYSINKYNNLMIKINEDNKRKHDIQKILYGNELTKTTNHSVNDLINKCKYYNFIFIFSFISFGAGALIFYKK